MTRPTKEYNAAYYRKNKDRRKPYIVARQRRIRDEVQSLKLLLGCALCGYSKCAEALHFHHTDDSKEGNICQWTAQGRSLSAIKKEISKCICVCANCHAEIHNPP